MPIIERFVNESSGSKSVGKPLTIRLKGNLMLANHSIRSVAQELLAMSQNQDFISVNVIGKQSTGKTELIKTVAHLIHTFSKTPYIVKFLGRDDFRNLEETLTNLPASDVILVFDDLAFLQDKSNRKDIDNLQYVLSVARHLPNRKDVRVIIFKSFQYTKSISPFLRQNDAIFLSSVDTNEEKSLYEMLGKKYVQKIELFKKIRSQVLRNEDFVFPLGTHGKTFRYKTKKPFLPFLYSNGDSLRFCCSPLRSFFDPICQVCSPSKQTQEAKVNLDSFVADYSKKFTKGIAKRAVELKLLQMGITPLPKRVMQAQKYIEQFLKQKQINLEELALAFNLKPNSTKLFPDKQPEIVTQ